MRFGLIGAGAIGQVRAQALATAPGFELAGIQDLDKNRAAAVAPTARFYAAVEDMFVAPDIDAVIISTPPQFHEALAIQAMKAGKHVLVEKPMAATPDACRRMVAVAHSTGRLLTVGFNHRYFPALKLVRDAVQSGVLGNLSHVRAYAGHMGLSEFKAPWMYDKAVMGGGALMDNGIHVLDLVRYLMGDFNEVFGNISTKVWNLDGAEDNAIALFRSPQGVLGSLQASWSEWKGYRFHVEAYGDRGMARAYYAPMMATVITLDKPGGARRIQRRFFPEIAIREKLRGWQSTTIQAFHEEFLDFRALTRGESGTGRIATGLDGQRSIEVAHAVYASNETRQATILPELPV